MFSFLFPFFHYFFIFQSSEQTPKPENNHREVLLVKMTIFFSENLILGPRGQGGVRNGPFEGDPVFMFFSFFTIFLGKDFLFSCISLKYVSLLAFGVRVSLVMFAP